MANEKTETLPTITLLYIGRTDLTETVKGKKKSSTGTRWLSLEGPKEGWPQLHLDFRKELFYSVSKMPKCRPGTIYEFITPKAGFIRTSCPKFVGHWHDKAMIIQWEAELDAFNLVREEAKLANKNHLLEALDPIRTAYKHMNTMQQSALLVKIMSYVRGYSGHTAKKED